MRRKGKHSGDRQDTAAFSAVPEQPVTKRSRKGLIAGTVLGGCLLLAVIVFAVAAVFVGQVGTIYPNVSVGGYELGGLSRAEAEDILNVDAGWSDLDHPAITVEMPGGTLSISYELAGMTSNGTQAAQMAYDYGRSGNRMKDTLVYLRSMVLGKDLTEQVFASADEQQIRQAVKTGLEEVRANLEKDWTLDEENETITLVKGSGHIDLDDEAVTQLILGALKDGQFGTVKYEPESKGETVDIQTLHQEICQEPIDAYYDEETDSIMPDQVGIAFDPEQMREVWESAAVGDTVVLDVTVTQPEETEEHLQEVLFQTKLAEKATSLAGSSDNRLNNVELAAKAINGVVLMPGEQFSYNLTLGQRTKENGYLPAGAYANGAVVQEVGGGICQVSSTLYYCTLVSNLQIDYRVNHYFPVGYLPAGYDATVSWKSPDFKFTNDREYPIKIVSYVKDGQLIVEILGTDDGTYVELSNSTWPIYTNEEYPETATGYKAQAFRNIYDSATGKLIEKKSEGVSTYFYHEEDIKYPEPSPTPTPTPAPTPTPEQPSPTPAPEETPAPETTPVPDVTPAPQETPAPVPEETPAPQP